VRPIQDVEDRRLPYFAVESNAVSDTKAGRLGLQILKQRATPDYVKGCVRQKPKTRDYDICTLTFFLSAGDDETQSVIFRQLPGSIPGDLQRAHRGRKDPFHTRISLRRRLQVTAGRQHDVSAAREIFHASLPHSLGYGALNEPISTMPHEQRLSLD
jgi:hypothetical protein